MIVPRLYILLACVLRLATTAASAISTSAAAAVENSPLSSSRAQRAIVRRRERSSGIAGSSAATVERDLQCYNDRDCCFFQDCCNLNECFDYCYNDRYCCEFGDCCNPSAQCYTACYNDRYCCAFGDCCNPSACSAAECYNDDVCCDYQDCCNPYDQCTSGAPEPPEEEDDEDEEDEGGNLEVDLDALEDLCFPAHMTVQVRDKGRVQMKDLRVGDYVWTPLLQYEPIYAFGHYHPRKEAEFVRWNGAGGLEMTAQHMVYVQGKTHPVRAESLQLGDYVAVASSFPQHGEAEGGHMSRKIHRMDKTTRQGVYAPLTPSGTLFVDRIAVSSYISLQQTNNNKVNDAGENMVRIGSIVTPMSQQTLVHVGLSPYRLWCTTVATCHPPNGYVSDKDDVNDNNNNNGMPYYIATMLPLAHWIDQQHTNLGLLIQGLAFLVFLVLAGISYVLENLVVFLLGSGFTSTVLLGTVGILVLLYVLCIKLVLAGVSYVSENLVGFLLGSGTTSTVLGTVGIFVLLYVLCIKRYSNGRTAVKDDDKSKDQLAPHQQGEETRSYSRIDSSVIRL